MTSDTCMPLRQEMRGLFSGELNRILLKLKIADMMIWEGGEKEIFLNFKNF